MSGSLFISYSHLDAPWMQLVKKHLEGMLLSRCVVWTDEAISPGTTWEETLRGNLSQAAAGLVLASPDYLVSPWCRKELSTLAEAYRTRRLGAVYWMLLRPCGWSWCELKDLQAVQEPANRALLDTPEGPERNALVLQCCERIASGVAGILAREDPALEAVRKVLRDAARDIKLAPTQSPVQGDFSIVCRGLRPNGDDVYVKVLTNTPLHRMRELFKRVSEACSKVKHPSVVDVDEVFAVGEGYEQRIVILSGMARGSALSGVMDADFAKPYHERHLTMETVRLLLQRLAEALVQLHQCEPIDWPDGKGVAYTHLMGPLIPSSIYYDKLTVRPQISLVGITNFLWHFFESVTFTRIVGPRCGTYILPEKARGEIAGPPADQYFLGMLALELLEARPLFIVPDGAAPVDPLDYLERQADRRWAGRHGQMRALLARLLAPDPKLRFADMSAVVDELRALEDMPRALAKYSYLAFIAPKTEGPQAGYAFSHGFYDIFFAREPAVRELFVRERARRVGPAGEADEVPDEVHHSKLLDALKAVLNHRRGSAPSSIDSIAARHERFDISDAQFASFQASFLQALDERVRATPQGAAEADEIGRAWEALFSPVMREMKRGRAASHG